MNDTWLHLEGKTVVVTGRLTEVADLVCYLGSMRASYIHGVTYNVAGGKTRG